ncbi:MAG: ATP-binding cassette domain-containing protein [Planctomycetes bacterium]|nr:ATP-binding cassette domain-containing protein [Planctomycetota bacterium]
MTTAAAIRLENVSRAFAGAGGEPVPALSRLNLEIGERQTVALLGPSGCGKTTTLRLINRLIDPTSGRVLVGGLDVATADPIALRRGMGYVIQSGGLFPHMDVSRNIGLLCELEGHERERIDARVGELLELVRLDPSEYGHRHPGELSGGQRQRVGVARALALDPPVLLMDEPFGALDPITRGELQRDFKALGELVDKTTVLVTHDLDEAFLLADLIAVLRKGELVQFATPDELRARPADAWVARFVEGGRDA